MFSLAIKKNRYLLRSFFKIRPAFSFLSDLSFVVFMPRHFKANQRENAFAGENTPRTETPFHKYSESESLSVVSPWTHGIL